MALRVVQRHTFAVLPLPDSVPAFPARVPALPQFGQWPPGGVTAARSPRSASTGISVFSVQLAADVTTGSAMRQRSSTQNALVRCMTACCPSDGHARLKPVGHVGRGWPVDHYGNHQQAKDDRRPDADTDQGGIFISPCAFRIVFRIPRPYDQAKQRNQRGQKEQTLAGRFFRLRLPPARLCGSAALGAECCTIRKLCATVRTKFHNGCSFPFWPFRPFFRSSGFMIP